MCLWFLGLVFSVSLGGFIQQLGSNVAIWKLLKFKKEMSPFFSFSLSKLSSGAHSSYMAELHLHPSQNLNLPSKPFVKNKLNVCV